MKRKKAWWLFVIFCLALLSVPACQTREEKKGDVYKIFYVNHDNTSVLYYEYTTESKDANVVIEELIGQMQTLPERLEYRPPLTGSFKLVSYNLADGQLTLDFDEEYRNQEMITEILIRAAIVRTLTQVREVQYVSFLVGTQPLADASGNVVGVMNRDLFIDNAGNEINTYEKARLRLYFANEEGNGLAEVTRNKVYSSNISMERLVVEEIIAGPMESDMGLGNNKAYPVMNPETKVINVNIRDGICYVNLDGGFINQIYNVTPEVTIYAMVNSLVELSNVNKVQISIDGETNVNYRESISLSTLFERNLELEK